MATLISDYCIKLGVLALEGAFSITPEIGPHRSRKGLLRFNLECEHPAFIDSMYRTARRFARRNRGKVKPPSRGKAAAEFLLTFDAPPRNATFGDLYLSLALRLFQEVRAKFVEWQVEHHFMGAATIAALMPAGEGHLRLVRKRRI